MAVHRISLLGALVLLVVAFLLVYVIGFVGLLLLIIVAFLLYWAFGPGGRVSGS